ncbi:hypothetical protein BJV78DRAFT_412269 [Lactifluus subvellereus]|nr:hypothetical protein BJV78DRAFT_412269 [Lactifluus subvellereus]
MSHLMRTLSPAPLVLVVPPLAPPPPMAPRAPPAPGDPPTPTPPGMLPTPPAPGNPSPALTPAPPVQQPSEPASSPPPVQQTPPPSVSTSGLGSIYRTIPVGTDITGYQQFTRSFTLTPAAIGTTSITAPTGTISIIAATGTISTIAPSGTISIIDPTISITSRVPSGSNGAVIGGIAGGVSAVFVVLTLGLFYWCRKRRRDVFDGAVQPDRVAQPTGRTDLTGTEVTPYRDEPEVACTASSRSGPVSSTWSGDSSVRQYRESQALLGDSTRKAGVAMATSGSHYAPTSSDDASAYPTSSHAHSSSSRSGAGFGSGFPVSQPVPMSTKERKALRQHGQTGLDIASAPEEGE